MTMTTITCTATTRLTYAQCMAALAACPALPRGERCSYWHPERKHLHGFKEYEHKKPWQRLVTRSLVLGVVDLHGREAMRYYASPLRRLRDERRALRARVRELERALAERDAVNINAYGERS